VRDQARHRVAEVDQEHRRAAQQILADEAEGLAATLARAEREAAQLWRRLDVLSRLWLAGAQAGPPRFGPQAVSALQTPPRLASIDLPPVAIREVTEKIAASWRARFKELLEEPEEGKEAA
jgi:hypothetical protein